MCLAIPAKLIEYLDEERQYGKVDLVGVRRRVNTSLLTGPDAAEVGDYVLVHVGFAMSRISEQEARETLQILEQMGAAYADELAQMSESPSMSADDLLQMGEIRRLTPDELAAWPGAGEGGMPS